MEAIVDGTVIDPMAGMVAGMALVAVFIAMVLRHHVKRQETADPLDGLFDRSTFEEEADAADRRAARPGRGGAILRGQVDHLAQVGQIWGQQTRTEAIAQVAQVMRASVRGDDEVSEVGGELGSAGEDGSFVILAPDASEAEAGKIAQRLIQTLAETKVGGIGNGMRLTASFGVAGRRKDETDAAVRARADAALKTAQETGEDQVVSAAEWDEIRLLPAPSPSPLRSEEKPNANPDIGSQDSGSQDSGSQAA